jgi:hypothetical protein
VAQHYEVYRGDRRVLDFSPGPGTLVSTAPPPPPGAPVPPPHPFLHGAAHDAAAEGELRRLLEASDSVADFVQRLRAAGYQVTSIPKE